MHKSIWKYFALGYAKSRKFIRRSFENRFLGGLYQVASLGALFSILLTPFFAASDYSFNYMLEQADDAILEKSFDGAEKSKSYLTMVAVSAVVLSVIGVLLGAGFLLSDLITKTMESSIQNPAEANYFIIGSRIVIFGVFGILALIGLLTLQAAMFIANKNKALGAGDVLYNAGKFVRKRGLSLAMLNIVHLLSIALMAAPYIGGYIFLQNWASMSDNVYVPLFSALSYVVLALGIVIALYFIGEVLTAYRYSVYALLAEEAESTKYVVVYPKVETDGKGIRKGRFIEIISLDDEETHPLEPESPEDIR